MSLPFDHIDEAFDEQALFHEAALTNQRLHDIAKEEGIEVDAPIHFHHTRRFYSNDLQHIEARFADIVPQTKKPQEMYRYLRHLIVEQRCMPLPGK